MKNVVTLRLEVDGEIYICEAFANESIQITKRAQSTENVESAQGVITKQQFRIPLKGNTVLALGLLNELQIDLNYDIRKSITGSILINNFPRYKGSFSVLGIYHNVNTGLAEVELIFKGNETNLKAELSNITLAELLAGEQIPYNGSEIFAFYNDPDNYILQGWAWPMIDYGQNFTANEDATSGTIIPETILTQTDFKPAVSVRKIFSKLPVLIDVDSTADDLLDQFIPLHNSEDPIPILTSSSKEGTGIMFIETPYNELLSGTPGAYALPPNFDAVNNYSDNNFDVATDEYVTTKAGTYNIKFYVDCDVNHLISPVKCTFRLFMEINGVFTQINQNILEASGNVKQQHTTNINLNVGDIVKMFVQLQFDDTFDIQFEWNEAYINVISAPRISPGADVIVSENVPNLTAWDVVRTIATQCNGMFIPTEEGFDLIPWKIWIEQGSFFEITNKVIEGQTIKIEPTSVTGPKSILFTYENDEDTLNKIYTSITGDTYGQLLIGDTGTDFGTERKEIKVPFAATPLAYIDLTNILIPKFVNEEGRIIKTKPRLIKYNSGQAFPFEFQIEDQNTGVLFDLASIPYFGHWESPDGGYSENDYNFGTNPNFFSATGYPHNNLYVRFWEKYITETYGEKARKLSMELDINQNEFDNIGLNEDVFWKGNKLRFNSINNFDIVNESSVNVELVFRPTIYNIDIAPLYPYDIISGVVQWKDSSDNSIVPDPLAADLEESAAAYGFFYDALNNKAIQWGQLLIT